MSAASPDRLARQRHGLRAGRLGRMTELGSGTPRGSATVAVQIGFPEPRLGRADPRAGDRGGGMDRPVVEASRRELVSRFARGERDASMNDLHAGDRQAAVAGA